MSDHILQMVHAPHPPECWPQSVRLMSLARRRLPCGLAMGMAIIGAKRKFLTTFHTTHPEAMGLMSRTLIRREQAICALNKGEKRYSPSTAGFYFLSGIFGFLMGDQKPIGAILQVPASMSIQGF